MIRATYHPWRQLRDLGATWELRWEPLPTDTYGLTDHDARTITLTLGMSQAERRSTIAHEVQHALRGPVEEHLTLREELEVDRIAARLLLPRVRDVIDALVWSRGDYEDASEELWVDPLMLEVRLSSLYARERAYVAERLGDVKLKD